ncbi:pyridoxal phosphate-dependent aminotransferase [Paraliomyxa miuraensis]|uniref:pyridoxal phosphate-dependent aminotransferase n=1 Tax=Paraliomyxa miuraensis TaxID=376150 RepID=UPI002259DC78|nr:histidinol-phosphate transaminase [Paraliomyxa miuraensis]MCX4243826.1 aminotransferase class I/II-fold pyridoxal phosphate-dependent enzyme [Paraliomyxa miuraensis]
MSDEDSLPWSRHIRSTLAALSVYDVPPADPACARMHANENPEPWPAEVMAALADALQRIELGRYPDTSGRSLRAHLARRHGCAPEQVVLGNGSDEIIALLLLALSSPGPAPGIVVTPIPTFVMYGHTARMLGMELREVMLTEDLELPGAPLDDALRGASVCFLARPNNPTGSLWSKERISALVADHPDVVFVIDEAYGAYAPAGSSLWSGASPSNQVHMATLSKVGLAALRVGYCIAHPILALAMNKVRHPYNVSQTSLVLAQTVLARFGSEQAALVSRVVANRARLGEILAGIPGATVLPSAGNLVVVRLSGDDEAPRLAAHLREHDVLVKDVSQQPRLARCLRVSVGTHAELDRLAHALRGWGG